MNKYVIDDSVPLPPRGVEGGKARAANTAARAAMPTAHAKYRAWRAGDGTQYDTKTDFANDVSVQLEIKEAETIMRWIRKYWEKGLNGY